MTMHWSDCAWSDHALLVAGAITLLAGMCTAQAAVAAAFCLLSSGCCVSTAQPLCCCIVGYISRLLLVLPQVVVDTLYAGVATSSDSSSPTCSGHTFLRETVQAIVAGIRNPAHLELSIQAVQLLGACGVRLAAFEDAGGKEEAPPAAVAAAPGGVDLGGWCAFRCVV